MLLHNLAVALAVSGLVDDDFGMELLVGGAIVSLSLPVRLVWECVWRLTLPAASSETSGGHSSQPCCNQTCACACASACSMLHADCTNLRHASVTAVLSCRPVVMAADSWELDSVMCPSICADSQA